MNKIRPILIFILMTALIFGCNDCDDCLDTQEKNLLIVDNNGNNLLFGSNAIFDPFNVNLNFETGAASAWFVDEQTQSIWFALEPEQTTYILQLDDTYSIFIEFDLGERKSERCCGNQIYSTSTQVNGVMVDNSDTITITY
ncbi:hypothetical protein [Croceivirga thetidis]|uniref:Uncharacterized protein n=1 Tax=Croceivirga thetidis TaxID=2721623 RepID=A0ABX1GKL8_9FLAO|nr:hypothetical protein [Croceivirga thetidis]NKI30455.1 hypothetical protein [Croceivirga thetidis]